MKLEKTCEELGVDFQDVARWQYVITQNAQLTPHLSKYTHQGWHIYAGYGAQVTPLLDKTGAIFGYFIGIGVDKSGLITGQFKIDELDLTDEDFFFKFEEWLFFVAGRYTVFAAKDHERRVYCDPVGMNGVVFDEGERQVGSSLAMCLNRPTIDHPLYDHEKIAEGQGKYSFFHTRDAYAKRINPSCYIDLRNFAQHRYWPRKGAFEPRQDLSKIYAEITTRTREVVAILNANYTTALPLSGGQDSRLVAAMVGEDVQSFDTSFTHIHNYASRIDATIASKIAQTLDLSHSTFDRRKIKPVPDEIAHTKLSIDTATGMPKPLNREIAAGLHLGLPDGALVLRGHQTDLLRAVFVDQLGPEGRENLWWQIRRMQLTPNKDFRKPVFYRFLPFYTDWISALPAHCAERQVDLMFLEIYYNASIGLTFPALPRNFFMSPFNSRHLIGLSLQIDEAYRRKSLAVNDLLQINSQALHDIPFDYEFGGGTELSKIDDVALMAERTEKRRHATAARIATLK